MKRTLTDDDVKALIDEVWQRIGFHAGEGLIKMAWKGVLLILVILAFYGIMGHH